MNWKIAEAKQKFSELIHSTLKEPQLIYNRDRLVAVMIKAAEYQEFLTWRESQIQTSMAESLQELQNLCAEDNYTLFVPARQNRSDFYLTSEKTI